MSLSQLDLHFLKMASLQSQADPKKITSKANEKLGGKGKRGAVLAVGQRILAIGVSEHLGGSLYKPGVEERYIATVNAEHVVVGKCVSGGLSMVGATLYVSDCPNWYTFKFLVTMGLKRIIFYGPISSQRMSHYAIELGVEIISVA